MAAEDTMGVVEDRGDTTTMADATPEAAMSARYPIDFEWSIATPSTNEGFADRKSGILAGQSDNNVLEITGLYYEGEEKPADFENMGLARAAFTKDLVAPDLPDDRVNLRSRLVAEKEGVREGYFEAVEFDWIQMEEKAAATVEELDDRKIIRFPFNSTEKDYDPSVDEYLDKLAAHLKQSGEKVRLVGHTDNVGGDDSNVVLSDRRAKQIRDILRNKGVSRDQIITEAKGETQPVAGNDTEEGRHDNRRVEIFLIQN
ncbi:MAG: OmpA family protein [Lewinella sp.]|nr:OmpA family protein [Lewinella sp.]